MDTQLPSFSSPQELVDAFHLFTRASESLEGIHAQLLKQIEHLSEELKASNIRLSESLRETAAMHNELLHIIDCQPNGVLVMDLGGKILHANRQVYELLGLAAEHFCNQLQELDLAPELRDYLSACLEHPEQRQNRLFALAGKGAGPARHLSVSASPLPVTDTAPAGIIIVVNDHSALIRLQEDNRRRERLSAMGAIAAQLAHEIRNPLNSIGLFASLIEEHEPPEGPGRKWCRQIGEAVQVLNILVGNMLNLAAPARSVLSPMELHQALEGVLEFAAELINLRSVRLMTQWGASASSILGDPELVRQMMLNLILNALQAMPGGGELQVRTASAAHEGLGQCVEIVVADTGEGMDSELLPMIFESGFSTRQGGHGLGLWIVGQVVERLQGTIQVSSQPHCGTEFRLYFPLAENRSGDQHQPSDPCLLAWRESA